VWLIQRPTFAKTIFRSSQKTHKYALHGASRVAVSSRRGQQTSNDAGRKIQNRRRLIILKTSIAVRLFVALLFAQAVAIPTLAKAPPRGYYQIGVGFHVIRQNGIRVGEIYVPEHERGGTNYVEHWVLYDNYVYPSSDTPSLVTTIEVGKNSYKNEEDFFARVAWGPGFRYVRVDCTDTDRLPGR